MPELAPFLPFVVPGVLGFLVVRLLLGLLIAHSRRAEARIKGVRGAWGGFMTGMFLTAIALTLGGGVLGVRLTPTPFWVLWFLGFFASAFHVAAVSGQLKGAGSAGPPLPEPKPAVPAQARQQERKKTGKPRPQPERQPVNVEVMPGQAVDTAERAIGKLPMPPARKVQEQPLNSDQAEQWYARQDARLGRALQGKTLAAARLRLSTVKSMLLLGQIGTGEADQDVDSVLRQVERM